MPFFGQFFDPKTSLWGVPGSHFGSPGGPFWCCGLPGGGKGDAVGSLGVAKGTLRCQNLIFNGFWVPVGPPLGVTLGSFLLVFLFFSISVRGWVAVLLFKWF